MEEIGPSFDLVLRRTHLASDDLYKLAHRQPKALKVNITWIELMDIFSKMLLMESKIKCILRIIMDK